MAEARYDVVVVGAGSAGAVVASRLSEDLQRSVLLLEAGPDLLIDHVPPAISGSSFNDAKLLRDRVWSDVDAVRAAGQPPKAYTRGRGIGGSSVINAMVALPGEPQDYDAWEREWGCTGWGWSDVAPWFARVAVPLHPARANEHQPINRALLRCGAGAEAAMLTRFADGRRASVVEAYLAQARLRANLTVRPDTVVSTVLLSGRTACGVRLGDGTEIEAAHVVVSAGAIHSPAILWRSCIDRQGIGQNLHDHVAFAIPLQLRTPADCDALPISSLARIDSSTGVRDLQLLPMDHVDRSMPTLGLLIAAVMHVHSRGSLQMHTDVMRSPLAEFDMLSDERDVVSLRTALRAAQRCLEDPSFAAVADVLAYDDSDHGLRVSLADYVHAAGTCRMGSADDPLAVVDVAGRVIGYEQLSVVDASVMPALPRANTHLPTVMIAERMATRLRATLSLR